MKEEKNFELTEEHEGIKVQKKKGTTLIITEFNFFNEFDKEQDPRKIFIMGQLHLEILCDWILLFYFKIGNKLREGIFSDFLKSEDISFMTKINLLNKLTFSKEDNKSERLIDKKAIKGLRAVAQIRNGFQHNLSYEEALNHATKEGANFGMIGVKLSECKDLDLLVINFKEECKQIYFDLSNIIGSPYLRDEEKIDKLMKDIEEYRKKKNFDDNLKG